ncbi:MAG TPA: BamA/TamA family outer membrane protein, partial [Vicinamibacterales bacterium]
MIGLAALVAAMVLGAPVAAQPAGEVIAEITVHGNVLTTDAEIRRLAGLEIGMPVTPRTVDEAAARLRAAKNFDHVEIRKRFASLSDPSKIVLVVIVDEGPVHVERTGDPANPARVVKNRGPNLLFLPILESEDSYGFSYGARVALPDPLGKESRISFPLTWGGERQAAIELDKRLERTHLVRFTGGAGISQRTNPFFDEHDTRERIWARAERELFKGLRVGATGGLEHVRFGGASEQDDISDDVARAGADLIVDTRLDPMLAHNAVYGRAAWEHLNFSSGSPSLNRIELDGRGYIGLFGQNVLIVRAYKADADGPLPPYLKMLFGGIGTVRGFKSGYAIGDTIAAGSLEVLVPLTSPLNVARLGVSGFVDAGAAYDKGQRFVDQPFARGIGGSVWVTAAFLRFSVAVAHG